MVALTRAALARPNAPDGDPSAQQRLCAGMRPTPPGWVRPDLTARTRFFDERVLEAISTGLRQVVVLGAGYDDRALRFRSPGVRFFEIDHPATQGDKARRLQAMGTDAAGPVLAPADFRHDNIGEILAASGHDADQPSLFVCEGLFVYLDRRTIIDLLGSLHSRAPGSSTLAASLATHPEGMDSTEVVAVANSRRRSAAQEPWRTILPPGAHIALLTRAGWQPDLVLDAAELDPRSPPGRCLLVTATR